MIRSLSTAPRFIGPLLVALAVGVAGAHAQLANNITGLYFTGLASNGGLQTGGNQDVNWNVTYASINGGTSTSATNEGAAYVINPSSVSGSGYTPNTSTAQWITAPGASPSAAGGSLNTGGDFLPGNGNTGANEGIYIYTLAFQVTGTGAAGTAVTNNVQITMTLAADDQYSVFVNPAGSGTTKPGGAASASDLNAWSNTTQIALQNYGGAANNASFVIGTNYLVVVVDNTNSINGASGTNPLNASGLLVYQTGAAEINGQPIPEVATWLPLLGVFGCYGLILLRRRQAQLQPVLA